MRSVNTKAVHTVAVRTAAAHTFAPATDTVAHTAAGLIAAPESLSVSEAADPAAKPDLIPNSLPAKASLR